jgi:hypothetical protein
MKLAKSLLLGAVAGLTTVAAASAADLPSRKSAPVEYVKVCNAYGAGFFYIPGTDTCLKIGGMVSFDARAFTPIQRAGYTLPAAGWTAANTGYMRPRVARDLYGTTVLGRVELDARNQTAYGTLRTFIRLDSVYSSASTGTAGALPLAGNNIAPAASKEVTYINKAFIQFAGLTAGRAQSMFDFYADAYNNELLRGSNATTNLLAYTATFGGGFSATLSLEDETARRTTYGTLLDKAGLPLAALAAPGTTAETGGTRMPDVVANLRVDQGWGSAQLSGALHKQHAIANNATLGTPGIVGRDENLGWAVQGGVKINLPMLAAGDALYLQATYAKGAAGYLVGTNFVESEGFNQGRHYGIGPLGTLNGSPKVSVGVNDCVFTTANTCSQSSGFVLLGSFKHFWTPTVSQSLFASYMDFRYPGAVKGDAFAVSTGIAGAKEWRVGTNVFWTPVKGFDIGAELMYMSTKYAPTAGTLAASAGAVALGLPGYPTKASQLESRIIIRRAF